MVCGVVGGADIFYRGAKSKSGLHSRCKPCYRAWLNEPERKASRQRAKRKHVYALSPERYDEMLRQQNGACAICGEKNKKLCVDHNHECCPSGGSCGRCVRGLLCFACNAALGKLENPKFAAAVAAYREKHRPTSTYEGEHIGSV